MAQADTHSFNCPLSKKTVATLTGFSVSICGSATITGSIPPQNFNSNWVKCWDSNQFAKLAETCPKKTIVEVLYYVMKQKARWANM